MFFCCFVLIYQFQNIKIENILKIKDIEMIWSEDVFEYNNIFLYIIINALQKAKQNFFHTLYIYFYYFHFV